jgi:hypothetical protein
MPSESERIARWRRDRLLAAGFPPELADRLSVTRGADLHRLLDLVDKGCPPELAVRIAGPDDCLADRPGPREPS